MKIKIIKNNNFNKLKINNINKNKINNNNNDSNKK